MRKRIRTSLIHLDTQIRNARPGIERYEHNTFFKKPTSFSNEI